ncbi:hypothetical protein [Chryseobacterium sp. MMS23-Vi53]|uniref:hypothetical protein n=1 Tax=Chryseobacterium sp. MMS23-Vi53 TaxID=3386644 RepID=UPI0039E8F64D
MENISENINLINSYLTLSIQQQFNIKVDLEGEYVFAENLVSKKPIIATTFSEKILAEPDLKMFLCSLITELNNEKCNPYFIKDRLQYIQESESRGTKKII